MCSKYIVWNSQRIKRTPPSVCRQPRGQTPLSTSSAPPKDWWGRSRPVDPSDTNLVPGGYCCSVLKWRWGLCEEDADEGMRSFNWEVVPDGKGHGRKKSQTGWSRQKEGRAVNVPQNLTIGPTATHTQPPMKTQLLALGGETFWKIPELEGAAIWKQLSWLPSPGKS